MVAPITILWLSTLLWSPWFGSPCYLKGWWWMVNMSFSGCFPPVRLLSLTIMWLPCGLTSIKSNWREVESNQIVMLDNTVNKFRLARSYCRTGSHGRLTRQNIGSDDTVLSDALVCNFEYQSMWLIHSPRNEVRVRARVLVQRYRKIHFLPICRLNR